MGRGNLNEEEIRTLRKNPYVVDVNERGVSYSKDFKFLFIKEYMQGKKPTAIFRDAGFDVKALGSKRIERACARWKESYEAGTLGVRSAKLEKYGSAGARRIENDAIDDEIDRLKEAALDICRNQMKEIKRKMCIRDSSETIRLPIMICQDGFITSHGVSNIELLEDEEVKEFVGEYNPENYLLKSENPLAVGPYGISPYYMEVKRSQAQAMKDAMPIIMDVAKRFKKLTGREYGFFEEYMMDDAEVALVVIGSSAGTGKEAVDRLRAEGKKVGLIKLRVFRPFPRVPLAEAMCKVKAVAIMDKAESFSNSGGPLFNEARSSLYDLPNKPYAINYIYGLGGRDITVEDYYEIYNDLFIINETDDPGDVYRYVGVRDSRYGERGFDHRKYEE